MVLIGITISASCTKQSFLDPIIDNTLNEQIVFSDSIRTIQFLNNIYQGLDIGVPPKANATPGFQVASLSDESEIKWNGAGELINTINVESFTIRFGTSVNGIWNGYYQKIRAINIYLFNVDKTPLSASTKNRTKAEVRFLRAYYYSCLMKYFGGIPLVGDVVRDETAPFDVLRAPYEECVNYLVSELDAIAPILPITYSGIDYGRITRGAVLALKGKVLLYAASPFFNGGGITDDPRQIGIITYPNADPSRWQKAFDAFQNLINMPGNPYNLEQSSIRPGDGFYNLFLKRVNNEYLLARMLAPNRNMENYLLPPSRDNRVGGGYGSTDRGLDFPTQELVDAFPMRNGKRISEVGSGYLETNPYVNRDPRFYYSIIYNEARYVSNTTQTQTPVLTYLNAGVDAIKPDGSSTRTGYYGRKMCDTTVSVNVGAAVNRSYPLIRHADVLLMYAEAANEIGQTPLAYTQLRAIRNRAGILPGTDGNYGLPASPTQAQMRTIIQNERFIELTFENHRMFDIKRWKLGEALLNKAFTSIQITKTGNNYTYARVPVAIKRIFTFRSYLWPIPIADVNNNIEFVRNPGW